MHVRTPRRIQNKTCSSCGVYLGGESANLDQILVHQKLEPLILGWAGKIANPVRSIAQWCLMRVIGSQSREENLNASDQSIQRPSQPPSFTGAAQFTLRVGNVVGKLSLLESVWTIDTVRTRCWLT